MYVLITSTSTDLSVKPVINILQSQGYKTIVYYADHAVEQTTPFTTHLDEKGKLLITIGDQTFAPSEIGAAWYRRPNSLEELDPHDPQRRMHITKNVRLLHDGIFATVPDSAWLNEPSHMRKADLKLYQLQSAAQVGLTIPHTLLSNDWLKVRELGEEIIVKFPIGFSETATEKKFLFTTPLKSSSESLPTHATPYPGIWQQCIPKKREWRITIVGNNVFAATIYTSKEAKNDWRAHQRTREVRFERGTFPKKITEQCFALLKHLGLRFGAFDFIETPDGEMIFLEVNANGQYGWLEDQLGFTISTAIAQELCTILLSSKQAQKTI